MRSTTRVGEAGGGLLTLVGQIVRPGMLTCAPLTADDVALVCNWAQDNAYQLRPRGVAHGWSPLTLTPTASPGERVLLIDLTKSGCFCPRLRFSHSLFSCSAHGVGVPLLSRH